MLINCVNSKECNVVDYEYPFKLYNMKSLKMSGQLKHNFHLLKFSYYIENIPCKMLKKHDLFCCPQTPMKANTNKPPIDTILHRLFVRSSFKDFLDVRALASLEKESHVKLYPYEMVNWWHSMSY